MEDEACMSLRNVGNILHHFMASESKIRKTV